MALIIGDSDILQACATCLVGVLIFLTIERKFDIVGIENKITNLRRNIEEESDTLLRLRSQYDQNPKYTIKDDLGSRIKEHERKQRDLRRILEEEQEKRFLGTVQYRLKNREDTVTFLTLLFFSLCIIFLIFVPDQWTSNTYTFLISRLLFTLGLACLLVRVVYRAIDLPGYVRRYFEASSERKNEGDG